MNNIKVIKNFLTEEECNFYIDYTESNLDKFWEKEVTKRIVWLFGDSALYSDKASPNLSPIADIKDKISLLFERVEKTIKEQYSDKNDLFVAAFNLVKQPPGSVVLLHNDTGHKNNYYFKYTGLIYLNTMKKDGILNFPDLNYSYSPKMGDFLMFPSHDDLTSHEVIKVSEDRYSLTFFITEDILYKLDK